MFMNADIPLMLLVTVQLYRPCCLQSSKLSVKNVNHRNILCCYSSVSGANSVITDSHDVCVCVCVLSSFSPPPPPPP